MGIIWVELAKLEVLVGESLWREFNVMETICDIPVTGHRYLYWMYH